MAAINLHLLRERLEHRCEVLGVPLGEGRLQVVPLSYGEVVHVALRVAMAWLYLRASSKMTRPK